MYLKSLEQLYKKDIKVNNEYYVDSVVNEAIELGYKVKYFEVDHYICWGTPNDLQTYQYWQDFLTKLTGTFTTMTETTSHLEHIDDLVYLSHSVSSVPYVVKETYQ